MTGEGKLNRREFLARSAKAAATLAATGAAAWLLRDTIGPAAQPPTSSISLRDFSIPAQAGRMAIATGGDHVCKC